MGGVFFVGLRVFHVGGGEGVSEGISEEAALSPVLFGTAGLDLK